MQHSALMAALAAAGLGVVLTIGGRVRRATRWLPSPVALGMAFLTPANFAVTMFGGAMLARVVERARPAWAETYLPSLAAGGIAGEALTGLVIALLLVAGVL